MKILIVEDDETIVKILKNELTKWNYDICAAEDFNNILDIFERENPQLVLMDIVLPFFNGYYWCSEIRKVSNVPIIFISSKSENMDIVMAVQTGGDDYIVKPVEMEIVIAKIQAVLRRSYDFAERIEYLKNGQLCLYLGEAKLKYQHNSILLTRTELQIMESLFRGKGQFVSRESIMEKCWQGDSYIDDNTLAVNIARLRKKINKLGLDNIIITKKNIGYRLSDGEEQ